LVTFIVISLLLAISLPWIQRARENARRSACSSNLHLIGIALLNYADMRKVFPPVSTNSDPLPDIPGDPTATTPSGGSSPGTALSPGAGYSWIVMILPDIEQQTLFQTISDNSNKFATSGFDPALLSGPPRSSQPHAATIQLSEFICPSFTGDPVIDTSKRTVGVAGGAIETGSAPPNYIGGLATANGAGGIAITNYNAILGTHIDGAGPAVPPYPLKSASLPNSNNGGMLFRPIDGRPFDIGMKLASITDGLSKTPIVAETRERRFASWYDGTMNWVVAARHSDPKAGATPITAATMGMPLGMSWPGGRDRWIVGTDGTSATGGTALNYGPTAEHPTAVYLPTGWLSDPDISNIPPGRLWGPSSQHAGGIVNHAFADAHVEGINDQIDPNVYLWIVTRNGGERAPAMN